MLETQLWQQPHVNDPFVYLPNSHRLSPAQRDEY